MTETTAWIAGIAIVCATLIAFVTFGVDYNKNIDRLTAEAVSQAIERGVDPRNVRCAFHPC